MPCLLHAVAAAACVRLHVSGRGKLQPVCYGKLRVHRPAVQLPDGGAAAKPRASTTASTSAASYAAAASVPTRRAGRVSTNAAATAHAAAQAA